MASEVYLELDEQGNLKISIDGQCIKNADSITIRTIEDGSTHAIVYLRNVTLKMSAVVEVKTADITTVDFTKLDDMFSSGIGPRETFTGSWIEED